MDGPSGTSCGLRPSRRARASSCSSGRLEPRTDADRDEKREADIREFEALCRDYAELERITNSPLSRRYPDEYDVSQSDPERAAEEVALSERNRLGLGDGPIGDLWGILEADLDCGSSRSAFPTPALPVSSSLPRSTAAVSP